MSQLSNSFVNSFQTLCFILLISDKELYSVPLYLPPGMKLEF